jgi:uncharacterized membrane protein
MLYPGEDNCGPRDGIFRRGVRGDRDHHGAGTQGPDQPAFSALWPTAISYAVSYLFAAIIWINHHHLMRFAGPPTLGLIWINFVHLFMVSLLPFATAWVAGTRVASAPVALYAGFFVCIDVAWDVFEHHVLARADSTRVSASASV